MVERYLIRLPWPPAKSSPNGSQGDFHGKAAAGKKYKAECALECIAQGIKRTGWRSAIVDVTFHPPRNGRFDLDNALARAKRGLDAVSDAVGVDDGEWEKLVLRRGDKVPGGCVMVDIRDGWGVR